MEVALIESWASDSLAFRDLLFVNSISSFCILYPCAGPILGIHLELAGVWWIPSSDLTSASLSSGDQGCSHPGSGSATVRSTNQRPDLGPLTNERRGQLADFSPVSVSVSHLSPVTLRCQWRPVGHGRHTQPTENRNWYKRERKNYELRGHDGNKYRHWTCQEKYIYTSFYACWHSIPWFLPLSLRETLN